MQLETCRTISWERFWTEIQSEQLLIFVLLKFHTDPIQIVEASQRLTYPPLIKHGVLENGLSISDFPIPYAPCTEYLSTLAFKTTQM